MTTPDRVSDIFHAVLNLAPEARDPFLAAACGGNALLRREVESLLAYEDASAGRLERPVAELIAGVFATTGGSHMVGRQIGPYTIVALLGIGGMGEVYRARDTRLGRDVAIKILRGGLALDCERRARFDREARLLAALNHPHIGTLYGLEDCDGITVLVLELIEGPTLSQRLQRGALAVPEALAIACQIADALEAAHEQGIIHRDLKPGNIMLQPLGGPASSDVRAKVLDFGLGKAMATAASAGPTVPADDTADGAITQHARVMSRSRRVGWPSTSAPTSGHSDVCCSEMLRVAGRSKARR